MLCICSFRPSKARVRPQDSRENIIVGGRIFGGECRHPAAYCIDETVIRGESLVG